MTRRVSWGTTSTVKSEFPISPEVISRMLAARARIHQPKGRNRSWQIARIGRQWQFCADESVEGTKPGIRHHIRHNKVPKHLRHQVRTRGAI